MKTTYNYYKDQLSRIDLSKSEYKATIVISHHSGKTNHLNLNDESAKVLVQWLMDNFDIESKTTEAINQ